MQLIDNVTIYLSEILQKSNDLVRLKSKPHKAYFLWVYHLIEWKIWTMSVFLRFIFAGSSRTLINGNQQI